MTPIHIARPAAGEHSEYYARYIALVPGDDALPALRSQIGDTLRLVSGLGDEAALHRYAPEKWSIKQVVGHLSDGERVFAYRALRIARGDTTPLAGFDENVYAESGEFNGRSIADLCREYGAVREASIALFASLDPPRLVRVGTANNHPISARALGWILAGHELHHRKLLVERYGLGKRAR
jgi:hypothetical protein